MPQVCTVAATSAPVSSTLLGSPGYRLHHSRRCVHNIAMSGMDYDRRSAVSSFYGGRKSSLDALNADFPSSPPPPPQFGQPQRARMDSASSFYNANRNSLASAEVLGGAQTAGYNPSSFFHPGREEPLKGGHDEEQSMLSNNDPGWDVYADFNNQGPRYSTAFVHRDTG